MNHLSNLFKPANILLPQNVDMEKWSVIACDQYTSEPEYWDQVSHFVGKAPSALYITLPEIYLGREDTKKRVSDIQQTMQRYLDENLFKEYSDCYIYTERTLRDGKTRKGLVGMLDLEGYDYHKGSQTPIRATEGTVLERIPPRVAVRQDALLETPHIMILIDDPENTVIGPVAQQKEAFEKVYDFDLMQQSGHLTGYAVAHTAESQISSALGQLGEKENFKQRYGVASEEKGVLLFAMGDGNHSLATAKECYEQLKRKIGEEKAKEHPTRYALVEIVNLHDETLQFEAIHRVVFGVEPEHLLQCLEGYYCISRTPCEGQEITWICADREETVWIENPSSNLAVGSLQNFLDDYLSNYGGTVDYIHGSEVTRQLGSQPGNVGFLLPDMAKTELFPTVILDGALPRKTFSMGHAWDKRFYLECRRVK